jgi:hypothetical protein
MMSACLHRARVEASGSVERQRLEGSGVEWHTTAVLSKMLGIELD